MISAIVWLVVGMAVSVHSLTYGFGDFASPGSGFIPFFAGLAMALFSAFGLLTAIKRHERFHLDWHLWTHRSLIVLGSAFGFVVLLPLLGFALTTFLLLAGLLRFVQPQRARVVIVISLLATCTCVLVFSSWLGVEFPEAWLINVLLSLWKGTS